MYSEKFIDYLLRYQNEPRKDCKGKIKKKVTTGEKPHFGFIYAKMMREKYSTITSNVR